MKFRSLFGKKLPETRTVPENRVTVVPRHRPQPPAVNGAGRSLDRRKAEMMEEAREHVRQFHAPPQERRERFAQSCVCAVHDAPFTVIFERPAPGKRFQIAGIFPAMPGPDNGGDGGAAVSRDIPLGEVDLTGWRCPHCRSGNFLIKCNGCGETVCQGRVQNRPGMEALFECRASCGNRATMRTAESITGAEERQAPARPAGSPQPGAPQRPALPDGRNTALLPGNKPGFRLK